MSNFQRNSFRERDVEQAITALKRGSYLLKYGRRGKPKFCPFRLSIDETTLIWNVGKEEKRLQLSHVSRIIPGQRTAIFQRYPRPEKEYQSFSLIHSKRSLDLICKDKDEAEIWFVALRAIISQGNCQKWRSEERSDHVSLDSSSVPTQRNSRSAVSSSSSDIVYEDTKKAHSIPVPLENPPQKRLGRLFSDFLLYKEAAECPPLRESVGSSHDSLSSGGVDDLSGRISADALRVSLSSAVSTSTQGSSLEDFDTLGYVFIWGEGIGEGLLGGGVKRVGNRSAVGMDALLPKALQPTLVIDVQKIACGSRHAMIVTKRGEIFSWGEGSGGRLGHGVEVDVSSPMLISNLSGLNIKEVACGEYHSCAVTLSGDLYTWGDGIHNFGLPGHGTEVSHWIPKKLRGSLEGMHVLSVSCGPWHTAAITSVGQLFTFGDGTFGALGHGDRNSTNVPREIEILKGLRTVKVSCGVWHTAAVVEVTSLLSSSSGTSVVRLFTWGDGTQGQLGHGNREPRLVPSCVQNLNDTNFCQVACGHSITVALTTSGQVYTMGSTDYGQLGSPGSAGNLPTCIEGKIRNNFILEMACGSHHVAVLSSKSEVYTWGKGTNGQLGHGDNDNRNTPTLVQALKGKQVKSVVCGSNFTAAIYLHKQVCSTDHSVCIGCNNPFSFKRKCHNCYNCGLVFCNACSSKKSLKASMAPNMYKPYRVCDDCYNKLNKAIETGLINRPPRSTTGNIRHSSFDMKDTESLDPKSHGIISRLSSLDSFRWSDNRSYKVKKKLQSNKSFQCRSSCTSDSSSIDNSEKRKLNACKSFQCRSSYMSDSSSIFDHSENTSVSVPGSTTHSPAASPFSVKSSPHSMSITSAFAALASHEMILDDSKQTNEELTKEISILREQVELLTQRSQTLEAKLEITSRQLKEATEFARVEAEKNKAAKEVVKSLTKQLNDMAERVSSCCRISGSFGENASSTMSFASAGAN